MDIEIRRSMWEFIREINDNGTTVILTTHYLEEAESLCRNIAIIDEGNIIQHSSMSDLLTQLNSETFVLYLRDRIDTAPELENFGGIQQLDANTIEVEVPQHLSINDLIGALERQHIIVERMRNKVNRLEELFVKMTAKDLDLEAG